MEEYARLKNGYVEIRVRCYQSTLKEWVQQVLINPPNYRELADRYIQIQEGKKKEKKQ